MGLLDALSRAEIWEAFYQYKVGLTCPKQEEKRLRGFIDAVPGRRSAKA